MNYKINSFINHVASQVTKAATAYLRSPALSDADVARGKALLKAEISFVTDNSSTVLENMGQQLLLKGRLYKTSDLVAQVDKVTASDVKSVRRFVFSIYHDIISIHSIIRFDRCIYTRV